MEKIYIYGTGSKTLRYLPAISLKYQVLGFLDSNKILQGEYLLGIKIHHISEFPAGISEQIIITSSYADDISQILSTAGIKTGVTIENLPELIALQEQYTQHENHYRKLSTAFIPQIPLLNKHLESAALITNRQKLLELLPKNGVVAELGVANGDYTSQILNISQPIKLHLIDVWCSEHYNETLFRNVCNKFTDELSNGQIQIHRKLSTDAADDFPEQYFDWIYIDTSHCYKGTKAELEHYAPKVKPGGFIAGHDYTMGNWANQYRYGVMEALHEFCVNHGWRIKYLTMDLSENQSFVIEKI